VTLTKLLGLGGARQVVAESLLLKHQLLVSNRSRQRAPNLTMLDRLWADYPLCEPTSHSEAIHDYQAGHAVQIPQGAGPSKIPSAVLLFPSEAKARTERPLHTLHR